MASRSPKLEKISPELARRWLEQNGDNRRTRRQRRVEAIARDIVAGNWRDNPQAVIMFNGDGSLYDGQHRLAGIVRSGKTVEMYVLRDVDSALMAVLDSGVPRSLADRLKMLHDVPDPRTAASTINWCWRYENNALSNNAKTPSQAELLAWFEESDGLAYSVRIGSSTAKAVRSSRAVFSGVHYEALKQMPLEQVDGFFNAVAGGVGLQEEDPALRLRNLLLNRAAQKGSMPQVITSALVIKALNAWLDGVPVRQLRWRMVGPQKEAFPAIGQSGLG